MSYTRQTSISGRDAQGEFRSTWRAGHWNLASAIQAGRKLGIVGEMTVTHVVFDNSGKGRGGHDGEWYVSADDVATLKVKWAEGRARALADGTTDDEGCDVSSDAY